MTNVTLETIPGATQASDRTLSFIYGPEHQRIRQTVALTGNGTSAYFAGSTWYLNGEDSLGLSYEKEIRANGTIENKHYVRSGGTVFALFTSRTGTLNGLPATTTSYLQQDHLGSVAAITSETGTVTERLAYDPWGKRRFITSTPGLPDNLDAIVGAKTDRGYTEHEHLDEVGIIHMNGRVYDPLIGRFMSADPIIQDPYNLKSFNRYSYVWNNPLKMFDPTGFEGVVSSYNYQGRSGMLSGQGGSSGRNFTPVSVPDDSPDSTAASTSNTAMSAAVAGSTLTMPAPGPSLFGALRNFVAGLGWGIRTSPVGLALTGLVFSSGLNADEQKELDRRRATLSVQGEDKPARTPEQAESDAALNGLTNGLPQEIGSDGKPKRGQYVNTGGGPLGAFDVLLGTIGPNGQKTLPDGSTAGIHPSTTTGLDTIHVNRPRGSQNVKVRYQ